VLDVEVQPGDQSHSCHSAPGLLALLDKLAFTSRLEFVRGDCDWGSDAIMSDLEERNQDYLFKIKKSKHVKELINKHHCLGQWTRFKKGWEVKEDELQCQSWDSARRVVIVRRCLEKSNALLIEKKEPEQTALAFVDEPEDIRLYEYSVLVTSLDCDAITIVQHYRDRADCENVFDEIKNQWGWGGYTTKDIKSCRFMARIVALIYNWWSLFARTVNPDSTGHQEAITSRPLLLTGVGRLTETGRQRTMHIVTDHGKSEKIKGLFKNLNQFFSELKVIAPQLSSRDCWFRMMARVIERIVPKLATGPPELSPSIG
jgi:hypothetical protein